MLHSSVQELVDWMYESTEDEEMTEVMSTYLMEQGESTMEETADDVWASWRRADATGEYTNLIEETDRLGWDCLTEGRVSTKWIEYARKRLKETGNPMSPERWTKGLMDRLLKITHQQWIYRNHKVHLQGPGGLSLKQHDEVFDILDELMYTDPD